MSAEVLPLIEIPTGGANRRSERATLWSATAEVLESHEQGPQLKRTAEEGSLPLSFAQERLWFLDRARPASATYNVPFAWRIRGLLDIAALQTALNRLVQRHAIFRTSFVHQDGWPVQNIAPAVRLSVTAELQWIDVFSAQPFDLSAAPLLRANLLVIAKDDFFLTIVVHHIAFDGWSRTCFFRELQAHYEAALRGIEAVLPELPVRYADYAVWHREWLASGVRERQMQYWRKQLAPPLPSLELPTDRPRSPMHSDRGAALFFSLPPALCEGVDRLRETYETTRFVILLAAFKALLQRYTAQEEIVVGSVAANRNRPELRNVIGCFVNTVVLRTLVPETLRFDELLNRVDESTRGAFANQEVPFEHIVEELKPARLPNRSPLFQVMFALSTGRAPLQLSGVRIRPLPVHNGGAKFDLSVELIDQGDRLRAMIEYDTDLFNRKTVHQMARHFGVLLAGAIEHPEQRICDLPLLTIKDEHQLLTVWNDPETTYPWHLSIPALFEMTAARRPSAIALENGATWWTYTELNRRANAIAHALRRRGLTKGALVAVAAERSPETVAAMLGILKAGGAYLPLDLSCPRERLEFVLQDSGATFVLGTKRFVEKLPQHGAHVLCLDEIEAYASDCSAPEIRPDDLAYVLYTSGSTGTPKGVCVPHRAIVRLVRNTNYIAINEDDVIAQAASFSFDAATFEIWGALLNGARLTFLAQEVVLSPVQLAEALRRRSITTLFLTTSLFNLVARQVPNAFQTLRSVLFGGEVADANAVRSVLGHGPPGRLLNVYGPTETTTFATWHEIKELAPEAVTIPIGRPISNTQVHLLDAIGNLVPVGVRGEIYIAGDGVALGYLNRPELTAQKFVERRLGASLGSPMQRMYRTGDFARRLHDGSIEFLGRADDQVKIRGFRVEPAEIENTLSGHKAVVGCCVVVRESEPVGKQLVTYVVLRERSADAARKLRLWLSERVPDYMVPSVFVCLPELPLNGNGKVDRRALPEPDATEAPIAIDAAIKPWIPIQVQLIHLWEELLGVKGIGLRDNFFELGGHSLLAVRLMDRIEQLCGLRVPVSALFDCATIEQLTETILRGDGTHQKTLVQVQGGGDRTPFFFLHGDLFGCGIYCVQLARQLGPEQPFYTLAPHGISDGGAVPSIETMAANHVRALLACRPHGPYVLGGFCISAVVALEMAQQLTGRGERVELVAMIDPPPPAALRWLRLWIELRARLGGRPHDAQLAEFFDGYKRIYRCHELWNMGATQKVTSLKNRMRRQSAPMPSEGAAASDVAAAYLWTAAGFQPRRYVHRTVMICCDAVMGSAASRIRRWRPILRGLESHIFDCEHLELVTSHSAQVASVLRAALDRPQEPRVTTARDSFSTMMPACPTLIRADN